MRAVETTSDPDGLTLRFDGSEAPVPVLALTGSEAVSAPSMFRISIPRPRGAATPIGETATITLVRAGIRRCIAGLVTGWEERPGALVDLTLEPAASLCAAPDAWHRDLPPSAPLGAVLDALLGGRDGWSCHLAESRQARPLRLTSEMVQDAALLSTLDRVLAGTGVAYRFADGAGAIELFDADAVQPATLCPFQESGTGVVTGLWRSQVLQRGTGGARPAGPAIRSRLQGTADRADLIAGGILWTGPDPEQPESLRVMEVQHQATRGSDGGLSYSARFRAVPEAEFDGAAATDGSPAAAPVAAWGSANDAGALPEPRIASEIDKEKVWLTLEVPDAKDDKKTNSYQRMGEPDETTEDKLRKLSPAFSKTPEAGYYFFTQGDWTEHIYGEAHRVIAGEKNVQTKTTLPDGTEHVLSTWKGKPYKEVYMRQEGSHWRESTRQFENADTYTVGDKEEFFAGYHFSAEAALKVDVSLAATLKLEMGLDASVSGGFGFKYSKDYDFNITEEDSHEDVSGTKAVQAGDAFKVYVGGVSEAAGRVAQETALTALLASTATAIGAVSAYGTAEGVMFDKDTGEDNSAKTAVGITFSGVALAALTALIYAVKKKKQFSPSSATTQFLVTEESITLTCGDASLTLEKDGAVTIGGSAILINGETSAVVTGGTGASLLSPEGSVVVGGSSISLSGTTTATKLVSGELTAMATKLGEVTATAEATKAGAEEAAAAAKKTANWAAYNARLALRRARPVS